MMKIRDAVERVARFEREQVDLPDFADWLEARARWAPREDMEMFSYPPGTLVVWGAGELMEGPVGVGVLDDMVLLLLGPDVTVQIHPDLTAEQVAINTDGVPMLDMSRRN